MFKDERIWRILCTLWTIVFMAFVTFDFFSMHRYENLVTPFAAIYAGILTLYAGTKEFDRWYELHSERHPGEFFVIAWTVLIFVLLGFTVALGPSYSLPPEVIASYIMVLSIFALTQKSKQLHRRRMEEKASKKPKL
jgi:hypothetical protein